MHRLRSLRTGVPRRGHLRRERAARAVGEVHRDKRGVVREPQLGLARPHPSAACLEQAALWDEVKDRLNTLGTMLSGGQQQRLTIARALSHQPEVLCLDEFSIAIDPVTTMKIEDVLKELRNEMTIILVTNLVQQARRLADHTMFLLNGDLIEVDETEKMFSGNAKETKTNEFVSGAFG